MNHPLAFDTLVEAVLRSHSQLFLCMFLVCGNALPAGEYIMLAEGARVPFSVVAPLTSYGNGTRLYKVFSSEALGTVETERLFGAGSRVIARHVWKAYPR